MFQDGNYPCDCYLINYSKSKSNQTSPQTVKTLLNDNVTLTDMGIAETIVCV